MALRTLSLGGIAWNTMIYVDEFPEPKPHTLFSKGSHTTVGSSGAGKALNFASLGCEATLWGLLGDDESGDKVRAYLNEHGIALIEALDPKGTMRHVNLMDNTGDRISIFAHYPSHEYAVDPRPVLPAAGAADIVSVTIMNYCRQFLPVLRELDKPTWIDIHDWDGANPYHEEFIEAADYLFMSSSLHPDWRGFLEARIEAGATAAVATHGAAGSSGITRDRGWVDVPAVSVAGVVDTNGAGDAFLAGFAVCWLRTQDLDASLRAGATQAARAVGSPELAPVVGE